MPIEIVYKTEAGALVHGVMAEFANPADLEHAAMAVRDAGYTKWDVFSPFPVHAMEESMGMKTTKLPIFVACAGITGAVVGFLFQFWVRHYGYATIHQGKSSAAWQVLIPVTFEIGVLFTAFSALFGMLILNLLPRFNHPLLRSERFLRCSDDKFLIAIEAADPKFEPQEVKSLFERHGSVAVELIDEELDVPAVRVAAH
ncbi:DUF3341 domain-containing protein [soil metagenome]